MIKYIIFVSFFVVISAKPLYFGNLFSFLQPRSFEDDSNVGLRVPALVTKYGYPLETHMVITQDQYILQMHRIPHGKNNKDVPNKPVIFLMHGLLCSSADWVLMGPENGLAFILADRGYDVWMGNARGNYYSRANVHLNPDTDYKFWLFSWHEIGVYDLPAMIDYTLNHTAQQQISYIGHSQGTTTFFVLNSMRPEYNDKFKVMAAFAPVAYVKNLPNVPLRIVAQFYKIIKWVTDFIGEYEFLPSSNFMKLIGQITCNDHSAFQPLCSNVLFLIAGYDTTELNVTAIPVILSNTPAGSSSRQVVHYAQGIKSGYFRQYDFGTSENMKKYGTPEPPNYDIGKISVPIVLYYGDNDLLTSEKDIDRFRSEIQNPVLKYRVPHHGWSHLDFLWGIDAVELLYDHAIDMIERF